MFYIYEFDDFGLATLASEASSGVEVQNCITYKTDLFRPIQYGGQSDDVTSDGDISGDAVDGALVQEQLEHSLSSGGVVDAKSNDEKVLAEIVADVRPESCSGEQEPNPRPPTAQHGTEQGRRHTAHVQVYDSGFRFVEERNLVLMVEVSED